MIPLAPPPEKRSLLSHRAHSDAENSDHGVDSRESALLPSRRSKDGEGGFMRNRTRVRAVSGLVALVLLVAACGSDDGDDASETPTTEASRQTAPDSGSDSSWDGVIAAAQEEGTVTVYSVLAPSTMDALKAAFEAAYPDITMEYIRGSAGDIEPRIAQEIATRTPGADVVINANLPWWTDAVANDQILPLEVPSAQTDEWQESEWVFDHYAVVQLVPNVIAWNTNEVDQPISSYQDIVDRPDLRDKQVITFNLISPTILGVYMYLDERMPRFLEALADVDPVLNAEAGPDVQALAAGEVDISLIAFIPQVAPLIEQGAPIDWAIPEEANGTAQGVGTLANGANRNAGQLFVEFLMSEEGQAVLNGTGQAIAPIEGIEGALVVDNFDLVDLGQANDPAVADPFRQRWESLFVG